MKEYLNIKTQLLIQVLEVYTKNIICKSCENLAIIIGYDTVTELNVGLYLILMLFI